MGGRRVLAEGRLNSRVIYLHATMDGLRVGEMLLLTRKEMAGVWLYPRPPGSNTYHRSGYLSYARHLTLAGRRCMSRAAFWPKDDYLSIIAQFSDTFYNEQG